MWPVTQLIKKYTPVTLICNNISYDNWFNNKKYTEIKIALEIISRIHLVKIYLDVKKIKTYFFPESKSWKRSVTLDIQAAFCSFLYIGETFLDIIYGPKYVGIHKSVL